MKTKREPVTGPISIWAVPRHPDTVAAGERLFYYELSTTKEYHWRTGAVCVHTEEVTLMLPGGINLYEKAVETLYAAKEEASKEYLRKLAEIDKQIEGLKLLAAPVAEVHNMEMSDPVHLESIVDILVRRDGMDRSEAEDMVAEARERVTMGEDPQEILHDDFGLEPDYIFELID